MQWVMYFLNAMLKLLGLIVAGIVAVTGVIFGVDTRVDQAETRLGANQKISELTMGTTLKGDDTFVYVEHSGASTTKRITVANATSSLQTFYDGRYERVLGKCAGLLAALSDETGSGLAVFGTSPTIGTPILNTPAINTPTINVAGTEAIGDLLYLSDSSGTLTRLGIGSAGNLLQVSSGLPAWTDVTAGATTFGFLRTTGLLSIASSTIYGLTIGDSLPATTTDNLLVENNASTTNLTVSREIRFSAGSQMTGFASSTNYEIFTETEVGPANIGDETIVTASCGSGKLLVGGGASTTNPTSTLQDSYPLNHSQWRATFGQTDNGNTGFIGAYAICITP